MSKKLIKPQRSLVELLRTEDSFNGMRDTLDKIKESLDKREGVENNLRAKIKELSQLLEEKTADDRVRELEGQLKLYRDMAAAGFFTQSEKDEFDRIRREHYESGCKRNPHMEVHWTGIGTAYVLKCPICGLEVNFTDYGQW